MSLGNNKPYFQQGCKNIEEDDKPLSLGLSSIN
jgi:hypothetical protein